MTTLYVTEQKSIIRKTSDRLIVEKNKEVAGQGQGRSGVLRMQGFACRPFGAGMVKMSPPWDFIPGYILPPLRG